MDAQTPKAVTEERLERALKTMAKVIDQHGDVYWPIFDMSPPQMSSNVRQMRSS